MKELNERILFNILRFPRHYSIPEILLSTQEVIPLGCDSFPLSQLSDMELMLRSSDGIQGHYS